MEYQQALQNANPGAFLQYFENNGHRPGHLDQTKAGDFFRDLKDKEEANTKVIIHDREHPQPPPHTYISGTPSPLHYGVPLSDGYDPGVVAVSSALFGGSGAFQPIPLQPRPVFRRRRRGDCLPEWSNAFVTRVDPCECVNPEETYTPYELARYRDEMGRTHTTLDFGA